MSKDWEIKHTGGDFKVVYNYEKTKKPIVGNRKCDCCDSCDCGGKCKKEKQTR